MLSKVKVLLGDLTMGIVGDAMGCALGRALNRDLKGSCKVLVEREKIRVFWGSSKGWSEYPLAPFLVEYNLSFDLGDPLKPLEFSFDPDATPRFVLVEKPVEVVAQKRDPFYDPTPAGQGVS